MTITYVGYSDVMIGLLLADSRFQIMSVITGKDKLSEGTKEAIKEKGISYFEVTGKNDLLQLRQEFLYDAVIMYEFGLILPRKITEGSNIYNIHPGDIDTNRGAHPVRWTILLGEPETKMTMYRIDGIDEGYIVGERACTVNADDDYLSLKEKMERLLPCLLDRFVDVYMGELPIGRLSKGGVYRRKVEEADYRINPDKDSYSVIRRKINAMIDFGGAVLVLEDKKYRVSRVDLIDGQIHMSCEPFIWK